MLLPGHINGLSELGGAAFLILNIRRMHVGRQLRGAHWGPGGFFTTRGVWNLFYNPHLGQWWSCGRVPWSS